MHLERPHFTLTVHVVPGWTLFLLSKTGLKTMGAVLDTNTDELTLKKIGVTVQLTEAPSGHYQLDLCNSEQT